MKTAIFLLYCMWLSLVTGHENEIAETTEESQLTLKMPGIHPTEEDEYWCYSVKVPKDKLYLTQFKALAKASTAHHMLLYGCETPAHGGDAPWKCTNTCKGSGGQVILFAWAKNAPPTKVPPDVGFEVGSTSDSHVHYFVLQIHYLIAFSDDMPPDTSGLEIMTTAVKPLYRAGVGILLSSHLRIPPNTKEIHSDVSCQFEGSYPIYPFAFRVHTHTLGAVVTGYSYNGSWNLLGKGNPQWPQAFYPVDNNVTVKKSDFLVARCTYDSSNRNRATFIGGTHNDEMCNFYFMYYTDFASDPYLECFDSSFDNLMSSIPKDSVIPPPPNPDLEAEAAGEKHHHHHHAMGGEDEEETHEETNQDSVSLKNTSFHSDGEVHAWSPEAPELGQIGGSAFDWDDNLVVFHRGPREWNYASFDQNNQFTDRDQPIAVNTLVKFAADGSVLDQWGKDMFFMPHGLFVDVGRRQYWVTDVALHQVLRFPTGSAKPDLILGSEFVPGDDEFHFCKPAAVTVTVSGDIYVADGYCNSRVVKFDSKGQFVNSWGGYSYDSSLGNDNYPLPLTFDLVHDIVDVPEHEMLCIADRQNRRVQCCTYDGEFIIQYHPAEFNKLPVYGLQYCPKYDSLVVLTGEESSKVAEASPQVHVITMTAVETWNWAPSKGFSRPHTLAANSDCDTFVVGEIGPDYLWRVHVTAQVHTEPSSHQTVVKRPGVVPHPHHPQAAVDNSSSDVFHLKGVEQESDLGVSLIIAALLVIPILAIVLVALLLRMKKRAQSKPLYRLVEEDYEDSEDEILYQKHIPNSVYPVQS